MPKYTVQNPEGRKVTFDWSDPNPPTDADMEEVFAAAGGQDKPAYVPPLSPEQQAANVSKAVTGADTEGKAIARSLMPRSVAASDQGAGIVRQATSGALDALSLPGRAAGALSTVKVEGGNQFYNMGGGLYKPKAEPARMVSAGENVPSFRESLGDIQGQTVAGKIVRDPALIPSLAMGGGAGSYAKTAIQGALSGAGSAAIHQADKLSQGQDANLGEAATEIGLSAAMPVGFKAIGRGIAKAGKWANTLISRFSEIDEDALKAARNPGTLAKAREAFAGNRGSLAGQAESLRNKVEGVSINDDFNLYQLNQARKAELESQLLASRPGEPLSSRAELSAFGAGSRIEDAATAARQKAGEQFGKSQDEILIGAGAGSAKLSTRSGLADVGETGALSQFAKNEAGKAGESLTRASKDLSRSERLQKEAAKNLGVSAQEIKWLKQNGTDFGWWFDEAKDKATAAARGVREASAEVAGNQARAGIAGEVANQAKARADALKQEFITLDAADALRNTGDFAKSAKEIANRHGVNGDGLRKVMDDAYNRLMSDRPINALEDATANFLERAGVGKNGKNYGVIGNTSIPEGTVNEIRKFQELFKTAETVRDGLDQLRLLDDRINYGGPNSGRLFSSGSMDGHAIKMFRDEVAQTIENQIHKIDETGALSKAWIAHREAYSKTADALDMVRDGISSRTGNQETYFSRIKNIGVKNLRQIADQAKDDPNVAGVFNELRKGFYDNLIASGVTQDGFDHALVKSTWDKMASHDRELLSVMLPPRVLAHIDDVLERTAPVKMGVESLTKTYPVLRTDRGLQSTLENVGSKNNEFNLKSLESLDDLLGLKGQDRFSEVAKDFYLGKQLGMSEKTGRLHGFTGSRTGSRTAGMIAGSTLGAAAAASNDGTRDAGGISAGSLAGMVAGVAMQSPAGALAAYKILSAMQKAAIQASRNNQTAQVVGRTLARPLYMGKDQ